MQKFKQHLRTGLLVSLIIIGSTFVSNGRQRMDSLQISLITCGPGSDLYTTFGHTAVRVQDFSSGEDYAFNYGTFDFSTPHFYWKFTRGQLMYSLAVEHFQDFIQEYKAEGRKVKEQILNFNSGEKQEVFNYLKHNYLPENRFYKYDFLFDNCATRIRDIFDDTFGKTWQIQNIIPSKGFTFRQLINEYVRQSPWEKLGINLAFGVRADKAMSNREIMFIPHFLMEGVGHSTVKGKPLVKKTALLIAPKTISDTTYPFYKYPLFWFSLFASIVLLLSFAKPTVFSAKLLPWVDRCLFFLTGLLGFFLLFMWFGTDHDITAWNMNLLWLFPLNIVFSFYFYKPLKWVRRYALFIFILNIILLAGWFTLPQQLPLASLPVIAILAVRALKTAFRPEIIYK